MFERTGRHGLTVYAKDRNTHERRRAAVRDEAAVQVVVFGVLLGVIHRRASAALGGIADPEQHGRATNRSDRGYDAAGSVGFIRIAQIRIVVA